MMRATAFCLLSLSFVVAFAQAIAGEESRPPTPVFANNYQVEGYLSLPYAELNEPFTAWFDKKTQRSRTDYYEDIYKIYQFGPAATPEASDKQYGTLYKLAYVPASFKPSSGGKKGNLVEKIAKLAGRLNPFHRASNHTQNQDHEHGHPHTKTLTRQACFAVHGGVGFTIQPQTVLPDLTDFSFDSINKCPHVNMEHRHSNCELWKYTNNVGEKQNTYKMWVRRDKATGSVVPVLYYMLGYDSLLGSHYDRYDITYYNYKPDSVVGSDFDFDPIGKDCEPMPGPGDSSQAQLRSHLVTQNPIHEFVFEPHRYDHIDQEFDHFAKDHKKEYAGEEHKRQGWLNFLHNSRFIKGKNRELKTYKLGVNRFADNSMNELRYLRGRLRSTGYNGGLDYEAKHKLKGSDQVSKLPDSWDWELRGAVTPVKDQAVCGSCWSFGTSGTVEGAYFKKTGKLPRLSQQQLIDCSWEFGNNGCDGGEDFRAYQYIMKAGGLSLEEDYGHYQGIDGKCHDGDVEKKVKISGFYNVTYNDPEALKHAIVTYGPVTVAIDASRPTFTFYSHGVYYDDKCKNSPDGLDHQVLAVGYAVIDGEFVWLIKNSWSTYWGNDGYILMSAKNNNCGVMDTPTVPIIEV